jgi:nucleoside-diphosphate-sugar epimerase
MIGVTGANGLLGSFIVRKLIDEGRKFVAFKRRSSNTSLLEDVNDRIEWRDLDLLDPVAMDDSLKEVSSVIHSAALLSFNPRRASLITTVNTEGTRNVVNACLANGIKRLVYVSSVAALGRMKGQTLIDEGSKWVDHASHTPYATSKYYAELEVFRGQEEGLRTVIVNPSVILAPADWRRSSAQLFKYVWDERPFYLEGSLNYVDVRDVVDVTLALLNSGTENERFILNAGSVSYREFFEAVAARFGKKPPRIKLNRNLIKIVAGIEAISARIRQAEPTITPETARLAGTFFHYENKKIKKHLPFEFRTLDNTLDWCCRDYMQKFALKKA